MKKTGKKQPENRSDEVRLSLENLQSMNENNHGLVDKSIERNALLMDISVSLGLLVDICGAIYNKLAGAGTAVREEGKKQ